MLLSALAPTFSCGSIVNITRNCRAPWEKQISLLGRSLSWLCSSTWVSAVWWALNFVIKIYYFLKKHGTWHDVDVRGQELSFHGQQTKLLHTSPGELPSLSFKIFKKNSRYLFPREFSNSPILSYFSPFWVGRALVLLLTSGFDLISSLIWSLMDALYLITFSYVLNHLTMYFMVLLFFGLTEMLNLIVLVTDAVPP